MPLEFALGSVEHVEFGVNRNSADGEQFAVVPVDVQVQDTLIAMVGSTWQALDALEEGPQLYEPGEKHAPTEYLYVPLDSPLARLLRDIHEAAILQIVPNAMRDARSVNFYFCRMQDTRGRRVTALRRAAQFKGILKSRNRLVRVIDDTLMMIEDDIFKLDPDFDLLIDDGGIHILRPSGFEAAGQLQDAILAAVPDTIRDLEQEIQFIAFEPIAKYAMTRPRAARYLSSIRSQNRLESIDRTLLKRLCTQTGVALAEHDGVLTVESGHEMALLEVLDRRRYEVTLVREQPERYRAASRTKLP